MNVPNAISLARLFAVPIIVWLILGDQIEAAFWLSLAAAISDAVDGIIAKLFDAETVLGGFLDPIADKALLVCVFVSLGHAGYLPMWLVILVVFRDALIIGGALVFQTITSSLRMRPMMISKINTFSQLVLAVSTLGIAGLGLEDPGVKDPLTYIVGLTTLVSGGFYVVLWTQHASLHEKGREEGT